jgi:hypothetical protein
MLYLFIWIMCGLAAMAIYRNKGRSGGLALLAGLLFGPFGVLLALLTPGPPPPPRARICSKCQKVSEFQSDLCPKCGGKTVSL